MDARRPRELLDLSCRLAIVFFLFVVLMAAATLSTAAPVLARQVIENNRLLRPIELESTGSFPVSVEKQKRLASLQEVGGRIVELSATGPAGRRVVAGVAPNLWFPLQFFRADGALNGRWTDTVRQVHPDGSELGRDPIFQFWGIEPFGPLQPGDVPRMIVTSRLLASLGHDPTVFSGWTCARDPRARLLALGENGWVVQLPVERVEDLPDPNVAVLIPARLARMVEKLDPNVVVNRRHSRYELGPATSAMRAHLARAEAAVNRGRAEPIGISLEPSMLAGDGSQAIRCSSARGLEDSGWNIVADRIQEALGARFTRRGAYQQVVSGPHVPEDWSVPLKANMATVFVQEYSDIPAILAYFESNRETLKVRVINATNLEFVRTVMLSMKLGERVLGCASFMFLVSCLLGIGYSSLALIQRKLGELGILRAFGASQIFITGRFVLELTGLCLLGASAAWLLLDACVLPWASARLGELNPALGGNDALLTCGSEALTVALGAWLLTVLVVLAVIRNHIRQCPAMLLSLRE